LNVPEAVGVPVKLKVTPFQEVVTPGGKPETVGPAVLLRAAYVISSMGEF
jgi:hypothetical protein